MAGEQDSGRIQGITCVHCGLPIYDDLPLHVVSELGRECYHEDCAAKVGVLVRADWEN